MENMSNSFEKEKKGYKREQVDSYIKKLGDAYQSTYDEYQEINGKYNELLEYCGKLNIQEQPDVQAAITAKTLKFTGAIAQKIIMDAQSEAARLIDEALKLKNAAQAVLDEAVAASKNIISNANTNAAMITIQVGKNLELAYQTMEEAAIEVEKLFTYRRDDSDSEIESEGQEP